MGWPINLIGDLGRLASIRFPFWQSILSVSVRPFGYLDLRFSLLIHIDKEISQGKAQVEDFAESPPSQHRCVLFGTTEKYNKLVEQRL